METILIIEDNFDIRESTRQLLELEGYGVLIADSGEVGLAIARTYVPDIIVCDILMKGMNGYAVLHELRNDAKTAAIPIIFCTALAEKYEIEAGKAMGATLYLSKPFSENELLDSISYCRCTNKTGS